MVEKWNAEAFQKNLRKSGILVAAEFYTDWCPSCRTLGVIWEQVSDRAAADGKPIVFGKINGEEEPSLMRAYEIQSVPTLILFADGVPVARSVGALGKGRLTKWLEEACAKRGDLLLR